MKKYIYNLTHSVWRNLPFTTRNKIKGFFSINQYPVFHKSFDKKNDGLHILFANIVGGHRASNIIEPSLARHMIASDWDVSVVLCDGILPACLNNSIHKSSLSKEASYKSPQQNNLCKTCFENSYKSWKSTGSKVYKLSSLIDKGTHARFVDESISLNNVTDDVFYDDINLSEHVYSGTIRYYCNGQLNSDHLHAYKMYSISSKLIYHALNEINKIKLIDRGMCVHGIYVPHGVVNQYFQDNNINFYNWNTSYRKQRIYFSYNDTYHRFFPNEKDSNWKNIELTDTQRNGIIQYLKDREYGKQDWQQFNNEASDNIHSRLINEGIDLSKPVITLFTNVEWDARIHFKNNAYPSMKNWILDTINYFSKRIDMSLIIRVHPGEVVSPSPSMERVNTYIPHRNDLPSNVFLFDAEDKISSYKLASISNACLVFATKMSIELPPMGVPVIVTGDAWVKGKGITIDVYNSDEYIKKLDSLPLGSKLSEDKQELAIKYAYHFFYRRAVLLPFLKPSDDGKSFAFDKSYYDQVQNGNVSILKVIERNIKKCRDIIIDE